MDDGESSGDEAAPDIVAALNDLDRLVASGQLTAERGGFARAKLLALKAAVEHARQAEREAEEESRALEARLQSDLKAAANAEEGLDVVELRLQEESERAETEANKSRDRVEAVNGEVDDLIKERKEWRERLDEAEHEHAAAMQPQIESLQEQCLAIKEQLAAESGKLHKAQEEVTLLREHAGEATSTRDALMKEMAQTNAELQEIGKLPETLRRANDVLTTQLKELRERAERVMDRLRDTEAAEKAQASRIREQADEHMRAAAYLEKLVLQTDARDRQLEELASTLQREAMEAENHESDRTALDLELSAVSQKCIAAGDDLSRKTREKEKSLKVLKKAAVALEQAESVLPGLAHQLESLQRDHVVVDSSIGRVAKESETIKQDIEVALAKLLREETGSKESGEAVRTARHAVDLLEQDLVSCKLHERELARQVTDMTQQRERMLRQKQQQQAKLKESLDAVLVKDGVIGDLEKVDAGAHKKAAQMAEVVEVTKRQRDSFKEAIKACDQGQAEMKDKLSIVSAELEVLRAQSLDKDKMSAKAHKEFLQLQTERDKMRAELGRAAVQFWAKQNRVEAQLAEIDMLNTVINSAERDMLKLRRRYEQEVEQRNWAGLALIDRNDELCVLYEKSHVQEEMHLKAQLELVAREGEIRMLRIQLGEAKRAVEVTRRQLPAVPGLDTDIAGLQASLLEARRQREALSAALEDPENTSRWRLLEGRIPSADELAAKASLLEERLTTKRELLLEKALVLEEVTAMAERMRSQAAEGKEEQLELAKRMNDVQGRLRAATRSVMAAVAELSLYQATSIQLQEEKEALGEQLLSARDRLSRGEAPTEDADREVARQIREQQIIMSRAADAADDAADAEDDGPVTTAETRPTAYVPVGWAIPKPYGGMFPPFKPSDGGTTMRHIRKPEPRDIVL